MRMMSRTVKLFALALMVLALGSVMLVACARPGSSSQSPAGGPPSQANSSSSGESSVSMNAMNFTEESVTISKGASLTLVNSSAVVHVISNGTWANSSTPKPAIEPGAPKVDNMTLAAGQSQKIGPFTTAGTFQLYCIVHPGMKLTVTVQ